jgi:CRISPR/Cas system-associated endonuclease Cas1
MAKRKARTAGPQRLFSQGLYLYEQRRIKLWIPFLEAKIRELQARIQEKAQGTQAE